MVVGWVAAPSLLVGLALAQFLSGLALSTFEGTMDARAVRAEGAAGTASLAESAAARALGSAVAVASAPAIIQATGLPLFSVLAAGVLAVAAITAAARAAFRGTGIVAPQATGDALGTG
jgi:hypothetical protein